MLNYLDDLYAIKDILQTNRIILMINDSIWSLLCHPFSQSAFNTIKSLVGPQVSSELALVIDSVENLKLYAKNIHPRIETLLLYHERPLHVKFQASFGIPNHLKDDLGNIVISISKSPLLSEIIQVIGSPVISFPATTSLKHLPKSFDGIEEHIIESSSYVDVQNKKAKNNPRLPMLISYDEEGELIFLRQ